MWNFTVVLLIALVPIGAGTPNVSSAAPATSTLDALRARIAASGPPNLRQLLDRLVAGITEPAFDPKQPDRYCSALAASFSARQAEHPTFVWWPPDFLVRTYLNDAVGENRAAAYIRAKGSLEESLPLLDALEPKTLSIDRESIQIARGVLRAAWVSLTFDLGNGAPLDRERLEAMLTLISNATACVKVAASESGDGRHKVNSVTKKVAELRGVVEATLRAEGDRGGTAAAVPWWDPAEPSITVRGDDARLANGSAMVLQEIAPDPLFIETPQELKGYARYLMRQDTQILGIELRKDSVAGRVGLPAKLFGRFSIMLPMVVRMDGQGRVDIRLPWYHVFTSKLYMISNADVASISSGDLSWQSIALQERMSRAAQALQAVVGLMRAKHDAAMAALQNVR